MLVGCCCTGWKLIYFFYIFDELQEHCLCRLELLCYRILLHSILKMQNGRSHIHGGFLALRNLILLERIMINFNIFRKILLLLFLHRLLWLHYKNEGKEVLNLFKRIFEYHLDYSSLFLFYTILKFLESLSSFHL